MNLNLNFASSHAHRRRIDPAIFREILIATIDLVNHLRHRHVAYSGVCQFTQLRSEFVLR